MRPAAGRIRAILAAAGRGRKSVGNPESLGELYQELLDDPDPPGVLTPYRHRKTKGAFYTHPILSRATVRHALTPLVRGEDGPRRPEQIHALRVCDPAMGCGAFLLPALRFLSEALADSLFHHGWVEGNGRKPEQRPCSWWDDLLAEGPLPLTAEELGAWPPLRVLLARNCLHGVDVDPKAAELARAALALETGSDATIPEDFAENLRCGNALIGAWQKQVSHYPFGAWRRRGGDHAHRRGVHFTRGCWTGAIERRRRELCEEVSGGSMDVKLGGSVERSDMDLWCALWFWPADHLDAAPSSTSMRNPGSRASEIAVELAQKHRFFHWELEFPEVFARSSPGFDAVLGNPPWEILKPDSKAFFGEHDPLYGTYGKQRALDAQREMFEKSDVIERTWLERCAYFQDLGNWVGRGRAADMCSPFHYQGRGDPNTYKLFVELGHELLSEGGVLGMVVPSGLYTDLGCLELRELLMDRCRWHWLYSFENRERVFPIDSRFKFAPIVVQKGGRTETIRTAFLRRDPDEWAHPQVHALPLRREQVLRFSPKTRTVLEITHARDLEILEKICDRSVWLGSERWGIHQVRELDMTNDSRLFLTRPEWEAKGFASDGRGRWVRPGNGTRGSEQALPLIEGRMVGAYCFNQKGWVSGKGRRAIWRELPTESPAIEPQYLVAEGNLRRLADVADVKLGFMAITSATNARSMVAAAIPGLPCGNAVPILNSRHGLPGLLALLGILNSTVFDYALRLRLGGVNLNFFVLEECPLPAPETVLGQRELLLQCASLGWTHALYSDAWEKLSMEFDSGSTASRSWARTPADRLRRRAVVDAAIALLYGLDEEDLAWILRDCAHPPDRLRDRAFIRGLDPKGFWRVDRELEPEERLTVQTLRCFRDLISTRNSLGGDQVEAIRRFCARACSVSTCP